MPSPELASERHHTSADRWCRLQRGAGWRSGDTARRPNMGLGQQTSAAARSTLLSTPWNFTPERLKGPWCYSSSLASIHVVKLAIAIVIAVVSGSIRKRACTRRCAIFLTLCDFLPGGIGRQSNCHRTLLTLHFRGLHQLQLTVARAAGPRKHTRRT